MVSQQNAREQVAEALPELVERILDEAILCRSSPADDVANLLDEAAREIVRLRAFLQPISRMSGHPDKVVCLMTLGAARKLAEDALAGKEAPRG